MGKSKTKVLIYGGATGDKGKYTMTGDTYLFNIFRNEWAKIERKHLTSQRNRPNPKSSPRSLRSRKHANGNIWWSHRR